MTWSRMTVDERDEEGSCFLGIGSLDLYSKSWSGLWRMVCDSVDHGVLTTGSDPLLNHTIFHSNKLSRDLMKSGTWSPGDKISPVHRSHLATNDQGQCSARNEDLPRPLTADGFRAARVQDDRTDHRHDPARLGQARGCCLLVDSWL